MSRGKYFSLEEAGSQSKLKQFSKEHPSQADSRFPKLLEAMPRGLLEGAQASDRAASEGYRGTRTRPNKKEDTSG